MSTTQKPPRQLDLLPEPKPRPDRLFRRRDSRNWQARFWAGGRWQQRSTFTTDKTSALAVLHCWKQQYARRGAPRKVPVFADAQSIL